MKRLLFLFYSHYKKGTGKWAYQSSLWALLTLGMVNAFSVMLFANFTLLKKYSYLNRRAWEQNLIVVFACYFVVGYHILWMLYKKEKIAALNYPPEFTRRGGTWLMAYIIASIVVLILAATGYYLK